MLYILSAVALFLNSTAFTASPWVCGKVTSVTSIQIVDKKEWFSFSLRGNESGSYSFPFDNTIADQISYQTILSTLNQDTWALCICAEPSLKPIFKAVQAEDISKVDRATCDPNIIQSL